MLMTRPSKTKADKPMARTSKNSAGDAPSVQSIELGKIDIHPLNPREQKGDELAIERLGVSLAEGQLQPVIVREKGGGRFELIAGSRRYRAAKAQGLGRIVATVRNCDDREALLIMADENIQRKELCPIGLATQLLVLMEGAGMTQAEIAARYGKKTPSWVGNLIGLLKLPEAWRRRIKSGELSARKAKSLIPYADCPAVLAAVAAAEKQDPEGWQNADAWWKEVPAIADSFGKLSSTTAARRKNGTSATADSNAKPDASEDNTYAETQSKPSRRAAPLKVFDDDVSAETPNAKTAARPGKLNYGDVVSMLLKYSNSRADLELIRDHSQCLLDELGVE